MNAKGSMALFLLCANLGWIQGQFNFTELSLRYLLLQMVAQAITQAQIKKSYICYNKSGNNGKSTYLNLVRDFLGPSKVSSLSLQDICKGGFRTANIEGKWANIYPDLPKETIWDDSTFKAITGNDTIPVERKYEQAHDYANNAPFMFGTNEFPTINTSSNAFYNRFYLIEFPNQFPVDPKFNEKLFTEINKSALLNLVLEAVWNLKQNGPIPQSEDAIREQWLEESDNAYRFIKKYMVIDNEAEPLPFLDLHHLYSQDCIARKEKSKGQNKFKDVLTGYFGFQVKSKGPQGNQILYVLNAQVLFDELCLVLENPSDIP